jgi:hypothetical protein
MVKSTDFLQAFSSDPRFCLSIPVLWSVNIDGVSTGAINSVLSDAQESWRAKLTPNSMTVNSNILPAQEVTIPNESSSFQAMNTGSGTGGYLPGYGLDQRANFLDRSFTVNFLETKEDLEHGFFRPWMIAIGINGLVGSSLKATMEVKQYDNGGNFRKGFKFKKVFPTAVEGFTLNYENTDFPIKSVTFACENYQQL